MHRRTLDSRIRNRDRRRQFEGINRKIVGDDLIWIRPCTIVVADPGRTFGFVVGDSCDGTSASP
jgi:hypothetical protein